MTRQQGEKDAPAAQRCGGRRRSHGTDPNRTRPTALRRARLVGVVCCVLGLLAAGVRPETRDAPPSPPALSAALMIGPDRPDVRRLGERVAADRDLLAVAAPTDGDDALERGRVSLFRMAVDARGRLEARPTHVLSAHAPTPGDHFGASLALMQACGEAAGADLLAVGADRADAGRGGGVPMAGAVEVFAREAAAGESSWRIDARLVAAEPASAATFGAAVAFDRAGAARLAVGAPRHDSKGAFDAGRVHVFRRVSRPPEAGKSGDEDVADPPAASHRWIEVAAIAPPTPRMSMWFGAAAALDGDVLAIGSPGDDVASPTDGRTVHAAGAVYLYRRATPASHGARAERYRLERVLTAPSPEHAAWFGLALDLDAGLLAVAAPRARDQASEAVPTGCVYLYDLAQPDSPPKRIDPPGDPGPHGFGQATSLRHGHLLVGSPGTDRIDHARPAATLEDAGTAWLYVLARGSFSAEAVPPRPLHSGLFGASCAVSRVRVPVPAARDMRARPITHGSAHGLAHGPAHISSSAPEAVVAIVGHLYVEEESVAPSPGAAAYLIPRDTPPP